MKRTLNATLALSLLLLFAFSTTTFAAEQLTVAADSSSGTYSKALGEIVGVCGDENLQIKAAAGVTGGAVGNLDALFNNQADAAFLHSDVYFANAQADPAYNTLKTLVALWKEPIHILALKQSKTPKPKKYMMNDGMYTFTDLADLRGQKVGAAGGGVYTARILQGQGEGGFTVVPFDDGKKLLDALTSGSIAAAIYVGAAPLPNIEKLDKNTYKLLPISEKIGSKVTGVYRPATINYPGLTNGPVKTLAPMATLLTRKFSTEKKIAAQRKFRECFQSKLGELQDTGSRQWQQVDKSDQGVLPWYEIPGSKSQTK
ncbi:hypothetical protein A2524_04400 [Candidatus Wolfebacteria bacterium RIFOXYD12_FULL_48_21]|uniref:Solute-binding protein family 3/N-terminal domain-containing protein n=1 Tax=Candidatus Wolfebacteria bacterium RIFOXYD1_FULL_48_65 TaxID=1802561 RepID=A0A1F8E5J6_9BACT|nr:MAG: hypothetical protein A2610_03480 [Candidatus Wolfebacteria bacterium RIFOXYD1_FULL_48_65]OGM95285.1 MAG: hypothetical protein A2524_04400 [Candidatus Wolfebacteria bacterium RIFOXYD12_FULL_48_21]